MSKIPILLIFFFCLLSSCREELPIDPIIHMISVERLSSTSFYLKARLIQRGDAPITGYGFAVSRYQGDYEPIRSFYQNFKAGSEPESDTISMKITLPVYQTDTILYFHSYLENKYGIMYSKPYSLKL